MVKCWARVLGDCGGGQSGEHLVSECFFDGPGVGVQGAYWCPEPTFVGLEAIKSNILCVRHNSRLSPVDAEGGRVRQLLRDADEYQSGGGGIGEPIRRSIDCPVFERWLLKTTINLLQAPPGKGEKPSVRWYDGSPIDSPSRQLVRSAFGLQILHAPRGLYLVGESGMHVGREDRLSFQALLTLDKKRVVGSRFQFRGYWFLLWLGNRPPPLRLIGLAPNISQGARRFFRSFEIAFLRMDKTISQIIDARWPGLPSARLVLEGPHHSGSEGGVG